MSNKVMNVTKSMLTGMVIGGTIGVSVAMSMKKPTVRTFRRRASDAIDTVGSIMRSVADFTS